MLKKVNGREDESGACVRLAEASFPEPFVSGLEFNSPARGHWNIVHQAMLIPEGHEIYVCGAGCLRGVVLTAAEMNEEKRFSSISVRENNYFDGDMEELIIDGVADVLERLPEKPPAVIIYTSCVHNFMGCDLPRVYSVLRERFPDVDIAQAFMTPIMRKTPGHPDEHEDTWLSIYSLLKKRETDPGSVNIIANDIQMQDSSDIVQLIAASGKTLRDITTCSRYSEFMQMSSSYLNIGTQPVARRPGRELEERLGQKFIYLPLSYGYDEIRKNMDLLADELGMPHVDAAAGIARCEAAVAHAKAVIGDTPVSLDMAATPRPLGLAHLLAQHGFRVERLYMDAFNMEEKADFEWLRENCPDIKVYATIHPKMRFISRSTEAKMLAVGQRAAYFTGTGYFVNIIEGGGMYGFDGICRMMELMEDAFLNEKDTASIVQIKGMGCGCCS